MNQIPEERGAATSPHSGAAAAAPVTERGERTRSRLLAAAEEEFGQRGFHTASINSITSRAGVAQGTFYLYYRSKDEVFRALVEHMSRNMRHHLSDAIESAADRIEAEKTGLKAFLAFCCDRADLYRIVLESQFVDPEVHRWYFDTLATGYAERLAQAQDRGEVRRGDPRTQALALIGMAFFLGARHVEEGGGGVAPEALDTAFDFIEGALRP